MKKRLQLLPLQLRDSTLNSFKIAYKGSQFYVTVPNSVATMTDNEQKEVYGSVISLLESHNANAPVSFYDQNGNPVARMTLSGGVKLYK